MTQSKPYYTADDIAHLTHTHSNPGEAPFVRGPFAEMYRQKPWTIRQYTGFASAEDSNAAFKQTLAAGGQGLSVAFDLATHLGFDSDHPAAKADVGRTGVAIDSVEDMKQLFQGISLKDVSVSMTMNGAVLPIMAAFIVAADEQGVPRNQLRGTIQNDILKEFMVRNTYIFEPEHSMRICTDVVEYLTKELPDFNSLSISGYHFQEAGAEPALELALTLANAREYLDHLSARGLDIDTFCHRLSFFFGIGMNFFAEIAKLRAARLLWAEEVESRGAVSSRAKRMKMHCQTSGWSLTANDPRNNLMRTTIEAMAGILGGTQSLHTNAYDEALSLPTDTSARLARNTQLILQHETGLCDVADPLGGSYMVEALTDKMVTEVKGLLDEIDQQGGVLAAIESGWVRDRIHKDATRSQAQIDNGTKPIVGVNLFAHDHQEVSQPRRIDANNLLHKQKIRLRQLRSTRNEDKVNQALNALARAAQRHDVNLLQATINAIKARATVGECTRALLKVWPCYQASNQFLHNIYDDVRHCDTQWRSLQRKVQQFQHQQKRAPSILIVKLGLDGHDRGARVVAAGLSDAGFNVGLSPIFSTPHQVLRQLQSSQFDAIGVSLLSGAHLPLLEELNQVLQHSEFNQLPVFLGGVIPVEDYTALAQQGVRHVFGPGTTIENIALTLLDTIRQATADAEQHTQQYSGSDVI